MTIQSLTEATLAYIGCSHGDVSLIYDEWNGFGPRNDGAKVSLLEAPFYGEIADTVYRFLVTRESDT